MKNVGYVIMLKAFWWFIFPIYRLLLWIYECFETLVFGIGDTIRIARIFSRRRG